MGLPLFLFWVAIMVAGHLARRGRAGSQVQCSSTPTKVPKTSGITGLIWASRWLVVADTMCSLSWDLTQLPCCWDWCGPLSRWLPLSVVLTPSASLRVSQKCKLPGPTPDFWSGVRYLYFNMPSTCFWCSLQFENHYLRNSDGHFSNHVL